MMAQPLISIVIPVYNVDKYLSTCLDSVVNQTYPQLEIILVNDGSTDSSPEICDDYAQKDSRIKVVHKENGGLSDARNFGLKNATGEFMALIDSDDAIALSFCEVLLKTALHHDAEIIEGDFVKFENDDEIKLQQDPSIGQELIFETEEALELLIKGEIKQTVWNKLYKKEVIEGVSFEKGRKHEDEFWTYQIIGKAKKIVKITNVLYFYRQRQESIMGQKYSLERLDGLDGLEARMIFMKNKHPKLFSLSFKSFWSASSAHYQNLTKKPKLDPNGFHRKTILNKVKEYKTAISDQDFKPKDLFWLYFFLLMPNGYARLRNYMNIGI